jgi:hypothetical protein
LAKNLIVTLHCAAALKAFTEMYCYGSEKKKKNLNILKN